MQVSPISPSQQASDPATAAAAIPPSSNDVKAFNSTLENTSATEAAPAANKPAALDDPQQMEKLLRLLIQLVQLLQGGGAGDSAGAGQTHGGSIAEGGDVKPVEGGGPGGSAGSNELIPPPSEHIQQLNLGGKQVTVGGDGSASAEEVAATASNIQNLYDNSPTFRNMIDNSSDPSFEVTVGKRSDNTSWGNTQGRVYMNLNNVAPTNSDTFQSLLGHEFAHASIDLGHGSEMEGVQSAVAAEA